MQTGIDDGACAQDFRKFSQTAVLYISPTYSICREHGYLTGEQYTCPICGKTTEVYSRITGYYRPVQNWNDGKLSGIQRKKSIRYYEITSESENRRRQRRLLQKKIFRVEETKTLLFTTKTLSELQGSRIYAGSGTCGI